MPHGLSKQSLMKPPRIQPVVGAGGMQNQQQRANNNASAAANLTAAKIPNAKPFNRLVPVPPPQGFMMTDEEEEKKDLKP